MIRLIVKRGPCAGELFDFDTDEVKIGKGPANDLVLNIRVVSKHHGCIFRTEDGYVYEDLRSTNGSLIRRGADELDPRSTEDFKTPIRDKDEIVLGAASSAVIILVRIDPTQADEGPDTVDPETTVLASRSMDEIDRTIVDVGQDHKAMRALFQLQKEMLSAFELPGLARTLVRSVSAFYPHAVRATLHLRDAASGEFASIGEQTADEPKPVNVSRAILERIRERKVAVLFQDATAELDKAESVVRAGIRSCICVPLLLEGEIRGVLQVDSTEAVGAFTERDLEILTVFGNQLAS